MSKQYIFGTARKFKIYVQFTLHEAMLPLVVALIGIPDRKQEKSGHLDFGSPIGDTISKATINMWGQVHTMKLSAPLKRQPYELMKQQLHNL
jgi:hypothetical protein